MSELESPSLGATHRVPAPAATAAAIATSRSLRSTHTLSPSPCPFAWADCPVEPVRKEHLAEGARPDLAPLLLSSASGTELRPPPPPPRSPPVGQPRRICSRVGAVGGRLFAPPRVHSRLGLRSPHSISPIGIDGTPAPIMPPQLRRDGRR